MKLSPGTNKKTSLPTGETSGQPETTSKRMEYPEGTTHTIKRIKNGFLKSTSYKNPDTGDYVFEEEYLEKDPFSHVKGIKSK